MSFTNAVADAHDAVAPEDTNAVVHVADTIELAVEGRTSVVYLTVEASASVADVDQDGFAEDTYSEPAQVRDAATEGTAAVRGAPL